MFSSARTWHLRVLLVAGLIAVTSLSAVSQGSTFTTIDVPGAGTGAQQGTAAVGIDTAGDVAGIYLDPNGLAHGFVRSASGTITTFDAPGAGTGKNEREGTIPTGIDAAGNIVGMYRDSNLVYHGFVRAASTGTITTFDVTGAGTNHDGSLSEGTKPFGINATAGIAGSYVAPNIVYHGFIRATNGTISTFSAPDAGTNAYFSEGTQPISMNDSGEIAGIYIDSSNVSHGFVRSASGTFTEFNAPGVGKCGNYSQNQNTGILVSSIDAAGDVAGSFFDTNCAQHGFMRAANGTFTTLNAPGAGTSPCTSYTGHGAGTMLCGTFAVVFDAAGDITGGYVDSNGIIHGFLRPAETGIITSFDAPGAGSTGSMQGTLGASISSNASGITIVGAYADTNSVLHGFIYTPALTATTTNLTPAPTPNPSVYQEPVTLTATVSSSAGAPPNGENVTFMSGTTALGTAPLTSGVASLTTTALPTGTDSITAVYSGEEDFAGSTSAVVSQTVNKASSSTTLKSSLNPSAFGQSVTFTANISGQFSGVATGTVTFNNGSTSLGSATVSSNMASLATTTLPVGTDSITAVYSGDTNFANSTSNTVSQVVDESDSLGYTYSVYDFLGSPMDGSMIMGGTIDAQGNLYGITAYGGANTCDPPYPSPYGCGAIVKWDTTGRETVLHSFAGTDGAMPFGGIVLDGQGNLYGTTMGGGELTCNPPDGCGTIFKLNLTTLQFTVVHNFTGGTGDGIDSESPVLLDAQGNLYGTTESGGAYGNGIVFKVDSAGNETPIYSAPAGPEWAAELGAIDAQGNVYGTTRGAGADSEGSVFKIDSSNTFTTLYSFTGGTDGSNPRDLRRDAQGNLYGNTKAGSLYKLTLQANGTYVFSSVQNFVGAGAGVWPGGTVIDAQGNQYGTASQGGDLACSAPTGCGTVYKIDTSSNRTVLHAFTGTNGDGAGPDALLQDVQGNLYGGTGGGLSSCSAPGGTGALVTGCGTIFKLALPASIATTTTTLTSSQNPSVSGQTVTFTATVVASAGTVPNGETIAFMYGPILLGAGTLRGGTASFTTTALPVGTDTITVVYAGDPNFAGSQSNAVSQVVTGGPPFGSLDAAIDSTTGSTTIAQTDSLLVAGWVADPTDGAPLSNVKVYIDGTLIGTPTLGIARTDVAAAYGSRYLDSGYKLIYPAATLSPGTHAVNVVAIDSGGRSTTLAPLTITVQ